MAITKVWLDPEPEPIGSFEIREELERPSCIEVTTLTYEVEISSGQVFCDS